MTSASMLPVGTLIDGRYRILGLIGRGGFAHVYHCEHADLKRPAAVKVLEVPDDGSTEFVERFTREGRIIANLRHPNIVSIYDLGVHAPTGQPYLAMELLNGHDLEAEIRENGPVEPERLKQLMLGVLDALTLAHASGVVHKDLKPSNLFIADPGTPRERILLLDFGIAWTYDAESRLTQVGTFAGTPAYVAPEYAQHNQISPAVDVYQMGLIIGEALTAKPLVDGDTPMAVVMAHCHGNVTLTPDLAQSDFGPVIRRATSLSPSARYAEAGAFALALSHVRAPSMPYRLNTTPSMELSAATDTEPQNTAPLARSADPYARGKRPPELTRSVPQEEKSSAIPLVIVLLIVFGAVGFFAKRVFDARQAPPPQPASATVAEADPTETVEEEVEETENEELELTPRFVLTTRPINALVLQGRKKLGRTPLSLRGGDLDGSTQEFEFVLPGHEKATAKAEIVAGGRLEVQLKAKVKAPEIERMQYSPEDQKRAMEAVGAAFGGSARKKDGAGNATPTDRFRAPPGFVPGPVMKVNQRRDSESQGQEIQLD